MPVPGHRRTRGPAKWKGGTAKVTPWGCQTFLLCTVAMLFCGAPAAGQLANEQAIRTALVFNLTKYVEWPEAKKEIVIGYLGEGTMGESLRRVLSVKTSDSRPIRVLVNPTGEELAECDVAYLVPTSRKDLHAKLDKLGKKAILTIGETDWFASEGGMVGLVREGEQIRLQINLQAVQAAGLNISSRVLSLAQIVAGGRGTGS